MADTLQPVDQRCGNCNAWFATGENAGECRAHPPVPLFGTHFKQPGSGVPELDFYFPETAADWWCREFQKVTQVTPA